MTHIFKTTSKKGFTLVELLIVIALISILSVAVLATINPIEQANKARDSKFQNDSAEILNAYERYYANAQSYPWMEFTPQIEVGTAVLFSAKQAGFGICNGDSDDPATTEGECNTSGTEVGLLISADELKPSFVGKEPFTATSDETDVLYTFKDIGAGGSIYVCYVPKAKSNQNLTEKLRCLNSTGPTIALVDGTSCIAPVAGDAAWDAPAADGANAVFRCVPE